MVRRVPVGAAVLVLFKDRRGFEEGAVVLRQMVQTRPGEKVRTAGADGVVGPERIRSEHTADELVHLPERHVGDLVEAGAGEGETAEQNVEHERPVVADRDRNQAEGPQQLRDLGRLRLRRPEDLVVRPLDLEIFGHRLEQEPWRESVELGWQVASVISEPDHVAHDRGGTVGAKGANQTWVLGTDAVRHPGKIERHDRHPEGLEPRAELHGLAGADDAVGAGDDECTSMRRRAEHPIDKLAG